MWGYDVVDDFQISLDDQATMPLALVFTDSHGRVISLHGPLLDLLQLDDPGSDYRRTAAYAF